MKLYYTPGACSLAPHIVMREAGIPVSLEKVNLRTGQFSGGDFTKVNPKGYVPALELESGEILTEVAAVVQHLADLRPESGLIGTVGSIERARCVEWLVFTATELHKCVGPLWSPSTPDDARARVLEQLGKRLGYVDQQLDGRDYLLGSRLSVADAYLFNILSWMPLLKVELKPWPRVEAFMARMKARPKVLEALKAEGLL